MPAIVDEVQVYVRLAENAGRQDRHQERDRFYVLAAAAAHTAGRKEEGEQLRLLLIARNPNHLLKPYASFAGALASPDIQAYIRQLRRDFPLERANRLLAELERDGGDEFGPPPDLDSSEKMRIKESFTMPESNSLHSPGSSGRTAPLPLSPVGPASAAPGPFAIRPAEPKWPARATPPKPPVDQTIETPAGAWVGAFFFVVILLIALAALVYTLGQPWLNLKW